MVDWAIMIGVGLGLLVLVYTWLTFFNCHILYCEQSPSTVVRYFNHFIVVVNILDFNTNTIPVPWEISRNDLGCSQELLQNIIFHIEELLGTLNHGGTYSITR